MGCGTSVPANPEDPFNAPNKTKSASSVAENVSYGKKSKDEYSDGALAGGSETLLSSGAGISDRNRVQYSSATAPGGTKRLGNKCTADREDDDFDLLSSGGSRHESQKDGPALTLEGVANFASFCCKPKECYFCRSPVVTHVCETCDDFYFCMVCMDERGNEHEKGHAISRLHESNANDSRTFGAESSVGTLDCATNSLFFDPCSICNRVIFDTERVFHCEVCNFVECDSCHTEKVSVHEHELKPFQRHTRVGNVTGSAVVSKTRNSDGNKVINDYVVVKLLGKGSYAKVKLVQHRRTRKLYALKILRRSRMNTTKRVLMGKATTDDDLLREVAVMKFVTHVNLVQLNEVIEDTEAQKVYVIMEYCSGGPVHVLGDPPHPIEKVRKYGSDILSGLLHLHSEFLYHRDIKPANCLLSSEGVVKIADFGCCGSRLRTSYRDGTPAFNCPEQLFETNVSGEIMDSWSFAMTLYQMAFGELAVKTTNRNDLRQSLMSDEPFLMKQGVDPQLCDLLTGMLNKKLSNRMMLNDAVRHPFWGATYAHPPPVSELASMSISHADLCERALQSIQYGKRVSNCFYGLRGLRRVRRRLTMNHETPNAELLLQADMGDAPPGHEEEEEGFGKAAAQDTTGTDAAQDTIGTDAAQDTTGTDTLYDMTGTLNGDAAFLLEGSLCFKDPVTLEVESMQKGVLDLSRLRFSAPPDPIKDAADRVTNITFSSNGLRTLAPLDFTLFTELRELTITENNLTEFPVEVLDVKRLRHLDLSFNRISNVSPRLPEAWRLEYLSLNSNRIRRVGVNSEGKSPFSGRCLRNVRLCDNPLETLPEALDTCLNLNILLDDAPILVEEWGKKVEEAADRVVVVWNDIYPRLVGKEYPIYVTCRSVNLYKASIFEALTIQHAVIWRTDSRLPLGPVLSEDMENHVYNTILQVVNGPGERFSESVRRFSLESASVAGAMTTRTNLPPIFCRSSLHLIKSYFIAAESAEDGVGGFYPLVEYFVKCFEANEKVIVFFDEMRLPKAERELIIGAMCHVMKRCSKGEGKCVSECYESIVDAMKSIYS